MNWLYPFVGSQSGISMVEAAIGMPIFLIVVFGLMWFGITMNQKSTFNYALGLAPRMALPRGDRHVIGSEVISGVQNWIASGNATPPASIRPFLATSGELGGAFGAGGTYMSSLNTLGASGNIGNVPAPWIYALIYFYQTLRQGAGSSLRFPCDPTDVVNGDGCAICENRLPAGQSLPTNYDRRYIEIACKFRPSSVLLKPISGLIDLASVGGPGRSYIILEGTGKYKLELDNTGDIAP